MIAGTCQYCGCTEAQACAGGCGWANSATTLCTACAPAAETAKELVRVLGVSLEGHGVSLRLHTNRFERLAPADQASLVALCRTIVEHMRQGVGLALKEEALDAMHQIDQIDDFLLEHCPQEFQGDDSTADVTLRLLQAYGRSPLVLHDGGGR